MAFFSRTFVPYDSNGKPYEKEAFEAMLNAFLATLPVGAKIVRTMDCPVNFVRNDGFRVGSEVLTVKVFILEDQS